MEDSEVEKVIKPNCLICYKLMVDSLEIPCKHLFPDCMRKTLNPKKKGENCPVCRFEIL